MSSIEIRKYEYQASRAKNYFASPAYIDGINLTRISIDGFPVFNEEFANEFDSFDFKASDYDLVFSRMENTVTTTLSQSLETFLSTDLDNHCLVCKVTIGSKVFGGLIDVNSIVFIDDLAGDGYKLKLTIFSIAKEFSQAVQGKPFQPRLETTFINNFLRTTSTVSQTPLFALIGEERLPEYIFVNVNNLDWYNRLGYEPVLITELWAFMCDNDRTEGVVIWKLFEDLCATFGIIYKFDFTGNFGNYFEITMSLAFRDTGFTSETIDINWLTRERGFISDINANVIQCFKHQKEEPLSTGTLPAAPNETHFYGTVFNKDEITTADGFVYTLAGGTGEESLYSNGDGVTINKLINPLPFDVVDKVNFVEMNYYFDCRYGGSAAQWVYYVLVDGDARLGWLTTRFAKYISFPRMFTKAGYVIGGESNITTHNPRAISHPENIHTLWENLIENTGGACYPYLLQTFKKYAKGTIQMPEDFDINLFNKFSINHETYTIFGLRNLDLNKREAEIFAIQD